MTQLRVMQANPALAGASFNDPRMISVLGVLMGIDMEGFAREPGSDELPPSLARNSPPPSSASTSQPAPKAQPPKEEDVKMEEPEEDDEEAMAKKQALAEKAKGNESYKKREFESAIESFKKAWDLWPKDITFLTNMAGASPRIQPFDLY
jgi:stress-induced-phosphoprotein 1